MSIWRTPLPYVIAGGLGFLTLFVWVASQPQPPRWEAICVASHEEEYMSMETSPSGGGAPGGAYPVIRSMTVCDEHRWRCVTDRRWEGEPKTCRPRRER